MSKKMMGMFLTKLFTSLALFGFSEIGLAIQTPIFTKCLFNHCQSLHATFPGICTKFDAVPMADPL
jgi:hypothetical protein